MDRANALADQELQKGQYSVTPTLEERKAVRADPNVQAEWVQHVCSKEAVHRPNATQPYAYVLVMDCTSLVVTHVSGNIAEVGYAPAEVLHKPLREVIGDDAFAEVSTLLPNSSLKPTRSCRVPFGVGDHRKMYTAIFHSRSPDAFLELEPDYAKTLVDTNEMLRKMGQSLAHAESLKDGLQLVTQSIQQHLGYDRVMAYVFHADLHGEVQAETLRPDSGVDSFLGLHFPATDMPAQCRALFVKNLYSHLPDAEYSDVPFEAGTESQSALDLSLLCARGFSAGHLAFLRNMGVRSTLNYAILVDGQLWGLVACHHVTPKYVPFAQRVACAMLAEMVALSVSLHAHRLDAAQIETNQQLTRHMLRVLHDTDDLQAAFAAPQGVNLLRILESTGAFIVIGSRVIRLGSTPSEAELLALVEHPGLAWPVCTNALSEAYPPAQGWSDVAAGCLMEDCSDGVAVRQRLVFGWLRGHVLRHVHWSGNPDAPFRQSAGLQPWRSFERFLSEARLTARPWSRTDQAAARQLVQEVVLHEAAKSCRGMLECAKAMEMKDQFLANISHELRTPLYAINALSELGLSGSGLPAEAREKFEIIHESGTSLLGLLNDVIDLRRLEAGRLDLHLQDVDVCRLGRFCLKMFSQQIASKGLVGTMTYERHLQHTKLKVDRNRMQQVFVNFLSNAVKFTDAGHLAVHLSLDPASMEFTAMFEDSGIGVKEEDLPRLFAKFSQVQETNTRIFHGAGLGLAIAQQLVQLMGGSVGIRSEWQVGTKVWLTIPVEVQADGDTPPSEDRSACTEVVVAPASKPPLPPRVASTQQIVDPSSSSMTLPSPMGASMSSVQLVEDGQPPGAADRAQRKGPFRRMMQLLPRLFCLSTLRTPKDDDREPQAAPLPRILIAEDNEVLQKATGQVLNGVAEFTVVADGELVLETLQRNADYVMVLMDLQMPKMDGIAATKAIRKNPEWDSISIIGFTASCFPEELKACTLAGMDDVITKPAPKARLEEIVNDCVNGKYRPMKGLGCSR